MALTYTRTFFGCVFFSFFFILCMRNVCVTCLTTHVPTVVVCAVFDLGGRCWLYSPVVFDISNLIVDTLLGTFFCLFVCFISGLFSPFCSL